MNIFLNQKVYYKVQWSTQLGKYWGTSDYCTLFIQKEVCRCFYKIWVAHAKKMAMHVKERKNWMFISPVTTKQEMMPLPSPLSLPPKKGRAHYLTQISLRLQISKHCKSVSKVVVLWSPNSAKWSRENNLLDYNGLQDCSSGTCKSSRLIHHNITLTNKRKAFYSKL